MPLTRDLNWPALARDLHRKLRTEKLTGDKINDVTGVRRGDIVRAFRGQPVSFEAFQRLSSFVNQLTDVD